MCDAIHADRISDLPIIAELVQYPDAFDGALGDKLADTLSEVASKLTEHDDEPAPVHIAVAEQLVGELIVIKHQLGRCTDPGAQRRLAGTACELAIALGAAAVGVVLSLNQDADAMAAEPVEDAHG